MIFMGVLYEMILTAVRMKAGKATEGDSPVNISTTWYSVVRVKKPGSRIETVPISVVTKQVSAGDRRVLRIWVWATTNQVYGSTCVPASIDK
jgi:hypothetical protein